MSLRSDTALDTSWLSREMGRTRVFYVYHCSDINIDGGEKRLQLEVGDRKAC